MNRNHNRAAMLLMIFLVAACAGVKARDKVLLPAVATAWTPVKADIQVGMADAKTAGELPDSEEAILNTRIADYDAALKAKDRTAMLVLRGGWAQLKSYAGRGVTARVKKGEISAGVAQSFFERHTRFEEALFTLTDR